MTDDTTTPTRRVIEEAYNAGRLETLDDVLAPEFVGTDPALPEPIRGIEAEKQIVAAYRSGFPDLHITIDDMIVAGDKVVTRWTARGTHTGELWGMAPTGKEVTVTGIGIDRVANGRIVEAWNNWDTLGFMQQLGAVPVAAATT
jgi:steroid delta-isomerase-like uncharacterized protein